MSERFFMDCDESGHYFVVPASRRAEWEQWTLIPVEDDRAWVPPDYARSVGCSPTMLSFTDPVIPS